MKANFTRWSVLAAVVGVLGLGQAEALACATLFTAGTSANIQTEKTLIIWNDEKKIEHFVREITFDANTSSLGFLVPVPTRPAVVEVDEGVFKRLEALSPPMLAAAAGGVRQAAAGVKVLEEKRVAGMDMALLEADSATELAEWLKKNSFPSRPALTKWLESYVRAHFKIVAFKYVKPEAGASKLSSKAVRITFAAPYPYYPYKEPSDAQAPEGRSLQVYVLAKKPARGYLTEGRDKKDWAVAAPSQPVADAPTLLLGVLSPERVPAGPLFLTTFTDQTVKRPGEAELFFEQAPGN